MLLKENFNEKHIRAHRMGIPYRAEPDEARPCEAFDIRDARMGIPYRAKLDEARPCEAFNIRDARMGILFLFFLILIQLFIQPFFHFIYMILKHTFCCFAVSACYRPNHLPMLFTSHRVMHQSSARRTANNHITIDQYMI